MSGAASLSCFVAMFLVFLYLRGVIDMIAACVDFEIVDFESCVNFDRRIMECLF